ncbi:hypothetical protein GGR56DRAFT_648007 [Xylariaceae sp. FL0804]|nr:hypothetical protein GGR56DRAFT_648007 [Xylariaceae sp. FL0804]
MQFSVKSLPGLSEVRLSAGHQKSKAGTTPAASVGQPLGAAQRARISGAGFLPEIASFSCPWTAVGMAGIMAASEARTARMDVRNCMLTMRLMMVLMMVLLTCAGDGVETCVVAAMSILEAVLW